MLASICLLATVASNPLLPSHQPLIDESILFQDTDDVIVHAATGEAHRGVLRARAAEDRFATEVTTVADTEEIGFVDNYFPMGFEQETLPPEIEDNKVVFWIVQAFLGGLAGPLWIPQTFFKMEPTVETYKDDAIMFWLINLALFLPVVFLYVSWIPIIGWALGVVTVVYLASRYLWFGPVSMINFFLRYKPKPKPAGGGKKGLLRPSPAESQVAGLAQAY